MLKVSYERPLHHLWLCITAFHSSKTPFKWAPGQVETLGLWAFCLIFVVFVLKCTAFERALQFYGQFWLKNTVPFQEKFTVQFVSVSFPKLMLKMKKKKLTPISHYECNYLQYFFSFGKVNIHWDLYHAFTYSKK